MKCSYIFKKGRKKGELCNKPVETPGEKLCITHLPVRLNTDLRIKIEHLPTTNANKQVILKHYVNMMRSDMNSTEYYKNQIFVDHCISYPWNKSFEIKHSIGNTNLKRFISDIRLEFDKYIYGMDDVKNEIMNIICKFITNPNSNRNNIALHGPAGIGKNRFIQVLSKVLGLPMRSISLGGIKDSSFFLGHGYVYVESGPGKILQNVIDSKIANPIIYFDELDKVSESPNGKDIYSFLTYLTDSSQNNEFTDHYFYGMKFDLSRLFYVFSFNDISKIDSILLDRLNIITIPVPSSDDIVNILIKHSVPEILKNIGITKQIVFSSSQIRLLIDTHKSSVDSKISSGIRLYYRIIEKIVLEINKDILLENFDHDTISDELFKHYLNSAQTINIESNDDYLMMYS